MKRWLILAMVAALVLPVSAQQRAAWEFSAQNSATRAETFTSHHVYTATYGTPEATLQFVAAGRHKRKAPVTYSLDKDRPCVSGSRQNDLWILEMPSVRDLPAGTAVDFQLMFVAGKGAPKYYATEYADGKHWIAASPLRSQDGVMYNCVAKPDGKTSCRVWQTVRLTQPIRKGESMRFRVRTAADAASDATSADDRVYVNGSVTGQYPQVVCFDDRIPTDTLRMLFVGNSYTYYNTYPAIFKELAWHEGHYADCRMFVVGGYTLAQHLHNPYCQEAVNAGGYDYVFIQEQSVAPALVGTPDAEPTAERVRALTENIHRASPAAKVVMEVTWGRKYGNNAMNKAYMERVARHKERFATYEAMQQYMIEGIESVASEVGIATSPVGRAWRMVRAERPDLELYASDSHHPSYAGSYLAAAVAYVTVYGRPFSPDAPSCRLDMATAAYLRSVAERFLPR